MTTTTKERPILFSGPMVRALLAGTKTQTRRVVKPQPMNDPHHVSVDEPRGEPWSGEWTWWAGNHTQGCYHHAKCPYGAPGDVLWVKETWQYADWTEDGYPFIRYAADGAVRLCEKIPDSDSDKVQDAWAELSTPENFAIDGKAADRRRRPGIHFFRWMARISLEVVSVRVERVESITEADALAEGFDESFDGPGGCYERTTARENFLHTFYDLNERAPRGTNPWVWVVSFRRLP